MCVIGNIESSGLRLVIMRFSRFPQPHSKWLVADCSSACEEQDALSAGNAFMLFYERVFDTQPYTTKAHDNSIFAMGETSDYASSDSDDDVTLVNGSNGGVVKSGLRRRVGSDSG